MRKTWAAPLRLVQRTGFLVEGSRGISCFVAFGCILWGGLALWQCLSPNPEDGGQYVYTQLEAVTHAVVAFFYSGVFIVPPSLLASRLIYWPISTLRLTALAFAASLLGSVDLILSIPLCLCVAVALVELVIPPRFVEAFQATCESRLPTEFNY